MKVFKIDKILYKFIYRIFVSLSYVSFIIVYVSLYTIYGTWYTIYEIFVYRLHYSRFNGTRILNRFKNIVVVICSDTVLV